LNAPEEHSQQWMLEHHRGRIEAAWWGERPDAAPTLVLLHEGLGCVALWRDLPARLAAATGCGVFAYSRFGYGGSDTVSLPRPVGYMHHEALEVLPKVLDATNIKQCVLVGHSDGASIATIYAGACQDARVLGMVLIAPHFFVEQVGLNAVADARRLYIEGDLRARLQRYHRDVDAAFHGWSDSWLDPAFGAFDLSKELSGIRVPTLVIQGLQDPYGTIEQVRMAERDAGGVIEALVLPEARHAPHFEAPEATFAAITLFIRGVVGCPPWGDERVQAGRGPHGPHRIRD
jgi:pimeloyl-ACP methyl ester carboxylesterase